jgi:hypothetical protein
MTFAHRQTDTDRRVEIHVGRGQPFESRIGEDTVLFLRFRYDKNLVAEIKDYLARRRGEYPQGKAFQPGGWLPDERVWFVEEAIWADLREQLLDEGHVLVESK